MTRTTDEELAYQRAKRAAFDQYEQAISWCGTGGCGAYKAINTGNWPAISLKGLRDRLAGVVVNGEEHADKRILTMLEEVQLAKWLKEENKAIKGKTRDEQREKIQEVLKLRKKANRLGGRKKPPPLSTVALNVLADQGATLPADSWFVRFFATHEDIVVEKKQHRESLDRGKKHTEAVVDNHFFSPAGLKTEMEAAGVMDSAGLIDEWRLGWLDEAPQFIDYNSEKGGGQRKVASGPSDACMTLLPENRECITVNMLQILAGFMCAPQICREQMYVSAEQAAEDDSIRIDTKIFDDRILLPMMVSTYCQMSCTPRGVQTGRSFLQRMQLFDIELTALEAALGSSLRPFVLGMDNASSHHDDEAQQFCASVQIRLWYEESLTSDYLQALDQYNRKFHIVYRSGVKEERKIRNKPTMRISFVQFMIIFARVWFYWSSPLDRVRSFRKVGITAHGSHGIRPDLVNRSKFTIGEVDEEEEEEEMNTTVESPEGVRKDSRMYYKRKLESALSIINQLTEVPWSPAEAKLLVTTPQPSQQYISSRERLCEEEFGSYTLKGMGEKKRLKRDARQSERDRITTKQNASIAKKLKEAIYEQELDNFYWLCTPECTCGNG